MGAALDAVLHSGPMPEPEFDEPYGSRFEQRLSGLIDGEPDEVFRGVVQPAWMLRALRREAEANRVVTGAATAAVPHLYLIELSAADYPRYVPHLAALRDALVQAQIDLIRDEGWTTRGDVSVEIGPGEDLPAEHFRVIVHARARKPPPSAGTLIGARHRLEERIATGGAGDVWRGVDGLDGGPVVVKAVHPQVLDGPGAAERFLADAGAVAAVRHPSVVDIRDFGVDPTFGGYVVMAPVDGDALARTLARIGVLTTQRTLAVVAQVADALHALHGAGLVHRNVTPHHLLVRSDGTVVLTSFAFARRSGVEVLGANPYVPPEEVMGDPPTSRSDIYALGVVAYQCLAGRRPFDHDHPLEAAMRRVRDDLPPLPSDIPPAVRSIVERALARDPAGRWPTAADLATAARRVEAELSRADPAAADG
jgi:hypothetical protein